MDGVLVIAKNGFRAVLHELDRLHRRLMTLRGVYGYTNRQNKLLV